MNRTLRTDQLPRVGPRILSVLVLLTLAFWALPVSNASAASLTVSNLNDSGPGSLREAVAQAQATPGADTIGFSVSGSIPLAPPLPIHSDVTIDGSGQSITLDGTNFSTLMFVDAGVTAVLNALTIANGGETVVTGAISNQGSLTVSNSIFYNNHRAGITNFGGTVIVRGSTFSANIGRGAIVNSGTLAVSNSTFSGNNSAGGGGGIRNFGAGTLTVSNSTFSGNSAVLGGGIFSEGASVTLRNTIVANSTTGADCAGSVSADSHNLDSDGSCADATQKTSAEVNLGPLAGNGGPTQTFALLPGSAAIDTGDDAICAAAPVNNRDQRGEPRPLGLHCDIGAFEAGYQFRGFFQPVDNALTLNVVTAGRAVPVKFSLEGNQGLNILAADYPRSQQTACDGAAPTDDIETFSAGGSGLSYDAANDTYTYVWKTEKGWAGKCRLLTVRLLDGSDHTALFKFK